MTRKILLILLITGLLAACTQRTTVIISTPPAAEVASPTPYVAPSRVVTLAPSGDATPTAEPTAISATTTATLSPTLDPAQSHPLAGLTLTTGGAFWRVDAQGQPRKLLDSDRARISADGLQIVFVQDMPSGKPDVWLYDIPTGQSVNLTNTVDYSEEDPQFWPGQPERVFFASDVNFGMESRSLPSTVGLDGSNYTVLDEQVGGPHAISPDGQKLAYSGYRSTAMIYTLGQGADLFDPSQYGITVTRLIQPAWSPDGSRLAWVVSNTKPDGLNQVGLAIFDLAAGSGQLLHVYQPQGGGGVQPSLDWSPDGAWLALVTYNETATQGRAPALWLVRADGSGEQALGECTNPVWHPQPAPLQLACLRLASDGFLQAVHYSEANAWQPNPVDLDLPNPILFLKDWIVARAW